MDADPNADIKMTIALFVPCTDQLEKVYFVDIVSVFMNLTDITIIQ